MAIRTNIKTLSFIVVMGCSFMQVLSSDLNWSRSNLEFFEVKKLRTVVDLTQILQCKTLKHIRVEAQEILFRYDDARTDVSNRDWQSVKLAVLESKTDYSQAIADLLKGLGFKLWYGVQTENLSRIYGASLSRP